MINSIIKSISISLNAEFGDDYTIYTESVEQGLNEPCFFVCCINHTNKIFLGKRYFRENQCCIQYFPADKDRINEECNVVTERLFSCLEYITVTGDLVRGTKMKFEIVDGVLNFFVNYDLFVYKETYSVPMEQISKNITLKREGDVNGNTKTESSSP